MAAIASLPAKAINRKEQRQNQKERLKNEQKTSNACRQGGSYAGSSQRLTTSTQRKARAGAISKSSIFCSNWLKVKGTRANWLSQAVTPNKSGFEQASFRTARGSISHRKGRGKLNQLL